MVHSSKHLEYPQCARHYILGAGLQHRTKQQTHYATQKTERSKRICVPTLTAAASEQPTERPSRTWATLGLTLTHPEEQVALREASLEGRTLQIPHRRAWSSPPRDHRGRGQAARKRGSGGTTQCLCCYSCPQTHTYTLK